MTQIYKIENTRIYTFELRKQLSLILFAKQYFHQPKLSIK